MNHFAATLYRLAPVWGQNLMLTGFATLLERERYGGRYAEYQELLARTEHFSRAELEAYQDERLRDVVEHAYANVPYYRRRFDELKLKPSDIRERQDLPKLPLVTKEEIRVHFDDLRSRDVSQRALRTGHTSGTTGTPLTVGYDHPTIWITYAVFDRHYRWAGLRMGRDGDRIAVARGNVIVPLDQKGPPFWRFNRRQNQMLLSSFHLSRTNLPAYFEALTQFRPAVLDGYPSTLYLLAKYLQNRGETFQLRAAVTSSETLFDFQRQAIEERFACKVFDYYALAERAVFANECERHEGHHVAMEYGLTEMIDAEGQQVRPGVTGKLVGTTLHNKAMPLIRYVTNDMTAMKPHACTCGRALELMDDVTTKAEDVLTLKDGRLISPSVLTHPFKPLDCIEGSQIVQTAPDVVTVRLIPGATYTDAHTHHLVSELKSRLGEDVRIDVQMVDALETAANGKFKWVISQVPLGI
jgi:phenylacetate-CoA ligase